MKIFLTILLCILTITACNTTENQAELTELIDTNWILKEIDGQPPIPDTMISLQISTEYFSGSAGCNRYSAEYTAKSENSYTIDFSEINTEGCIEPVGVLEQEDRYTELLHSSTTYQLSGQELLLINEQEKVILRYSPRQEFDVNPDSLIVKKWRLISATNLDTDRLGEFTIRFDEGSYHGTTVCREYEGEYQVENDRFRITRMSMTTEYNCNEQDGHTEAQYTTLLENVEQYNVTPNQLELITRHGETLIFELVSDEK